MLAPVAEAWDLAVLPYYALAGGFLTGKYRPGSAAGDSPRPPRAGECLPKGSGARRARSGRGGAPDHAGGGRARLAADPSARRRADRERAVDRAAGGDLA